jgi:hypothetical protein
LLLQQHTESNLDQAFFSMPTMESVVSAFVLFALPQAQKDRSHFHASLRLPTPLQRQWSLIPAWVKSNERLLLISPYRSIEYRDKDHRDTLRAQTMTVKTNLY